jgi:hypothetical protein
MSKYQYKHAILGGTFDHFHQGHKKFLNQAFKKAKYILCGVVKSPAKKKLHSLIEPFSVRQRNLKKFLKQKKYLMRTKVFPIDNPLGPFFTDESLQAVFATKETIAGAKFLNQQRQLLGKAPLKVAKLNFLKAEKKQISSTAVRSGQASPAGELFSNLFANNLFLPNHQRQHLKKPIGKLLKGADHSLTWAALQAKKFIQKNDPPLIITVGDITTHSFITNKLPLNIAVLDFKNRRKKIANPLHLPLFLSKATVSQTTNPSGTITKKLVKTINKAIENGLKGKTQIITLQGEEDLSVLPLILFAPLESLIFYGQPEQGLVAVKVDLQTKKQTKKLLNRFVSAASA